MNEQGQGQGPRRSYDEDMDRAARVANINKGEQAQAISGASMAAQGMLDRGSRESARGILERRIHEFERKAIALRELSNALPLNLPPMADEALWQMLVNIR